MTDLMKKFGIPPYEYFGFKNIFSGSMEGFNYKIWPNDELEITVWYGPYCCEKSEAAASEKFEKSEEGLEELAVWLESAHEGYLKKQN